MKPNLRETEGVAGSLEVTPKQFYFDKLHPLLKKVHVECHGVDEILDLTVEKIINSCSSAVINDNFERVAEEFEAFVEVVTGEAYFGANGTGFGFNDEQKRLLLSVPQLVNELILIVRADQQISEKKEGDEAPERERIGYSESLKENADPKTMKEIWEPVPKKRFPNK